MNSNNSHNISSSRNSHGIKKARRGFGFTIEKRHKFIIGIIILSLALFFAEFRFGKSGIYIPVAIAFLTPAFLYWAIYTDFKENKTYESFILPFFYSLSFGMFYFLTPTAFIFRFVLAGVFAFGLYSVFLSQNIFSISSTRTITLLSGARIVSFVATLLSYFFLTNIIFTFHINIIIVLLLMSVYSALLIHHSLWTYTLAKPTNAEFSWVLILTLCLIEAATLLWFWPSSPTFIALFLTGFFYSIVGLSHIWFERRLFKGIIWEYVWVGCIVFFVLIMFTPWGK